MLNKDEIKKKRKASIAIATNEDGSTHPTYGKIFDSEASFDALVDAINKEIKYKLDIIGAAAIRVIKEYERDFEKKDEN